MAQSNRCVRLGFAGYRQEALTILNELEEPRTREYVSALLLAYGHVGLGQYVGGLFLAFAYLGLEL